MSKFKKIFKNTRVIVLIVVLLLMIISINPRPMNEGVAIRSVDRDSAAYEAGIIGPSAGASPLSRERVVSMNNVPVLNELDYYNYERTLTEDQSVIVKTGKGDVYSILTRGIYEESELNETEIVEVIEEVFNETLNMSMNVTSYEVVSKIERELVGVEPLGLHVYTAPTSNIRKGLDLSGGTRVLLSPDTEVTSEELTLLIENIKQRLNVYGLSDIVVKGAKDLSQNTFIVVEIAGSDDEQIRKLLESQGKFEAKIGAEVVFSGGKKDITYICRSPECSRLTGCSESSPGQWVCGFQFSITLSADAAQRQADVTNDLMVLTNMSSPYLNETLDLLLDEELTNSLNIAADLRGRAATEIAISGSGTGLTNEQAQLAAIEDMRNLQTVLSTGSLPAKLTIEKADSISPTLGEEFTRNAILVGILSMAGVLIVVYLRYRKIQVVIPMVTTMVSEVLIILGLAGLIGWNLDLAAIAGIIIAVGTGVDDQIVIADEVLAGQSESRYSSWKERLKKAFFIIMAAYLTTVVAMIPLCGCWST